MKCPHCNTAVAEAFTQVQLCSLPTANSREGDILAGPVVWSATHLRCPECHEVIIFLTRADQGYYAPVAGRNTYHRPRRPPYTFLAHPAGRSRPMPGEVVEPYRSDFEEACKVFEMSPKASAALSRRCLQALLRDKLGVQHANLFDEIEEATAASKLPAYIAESLHDVRQIGNFAAHPMKSTTTGSIVDVEPGEAEWNLDVLEMLFDHCFALPDRKAKRRSALDQKLQDTKKQNP